MAPGVRGTLAKRPDPWRKRTRQRLRATSPAPWPVLLPTPFPLAGNGLRTDGTRAGPGPLVAKRCLSPRAPSPQRPTALLPAGPPPGACQAGHTFQSVDKARPSAGPPAHGQGFVEGRYRPLVLTLTQGRKTQVDQSFGDDLLTRILVFAGERQSLFAERRRPFVVALQHGRVPQAAQGHADAQRVPRFPGQRQAFLPQRR